MSDAPKFNIHDYVYEKGYDCPVCEKGFTASAVKESKLRIVKVELDLHPVHHPIDPNFYDVIICPKCGYSAAKDNFNNIGSRQAEMILNEVTPNFAPKQYPAELDVDMAIERYKMALRCAMAKNAKDGEKAYLCLKLMWFYRLKGDEESQRLYAKLTHKGFSTALMKESLPIMGLNGDTITYLLGALLMLLGEPQGALRYLSEVIVSKTASRRLKDKARDVKDAFNGR